MESTDPSLSTRCSTPASSRSSPPAGDGKGGFLNVNADLAAASIAVAMRARKLVLATGAPGILRDANDPHSLVSALSAEELDGLIASGALGGGRIDTVKHMDPGATRFVTSAFHEFAQSLGKESFFLVGEITGSRGFAVELMETTGLDAALGLADVQDRLENTVKGWANPSEYFALFRNSLQVGHGTHTWFRDHVVTSYDDHDQVRKGENKARFAADLEGRALALAALVANATTLGIPCIYYGTERCFDGRGGNDRYIREAMFGGSFGAFRSADRHCFNETTSTYVELAAVLARATAGAGATQRPPIPAAHLGRRNPLQASPARRRPHHIHSGMEQNSRGPRGHLRDQHRHRSRKDRLGHRRRRPTRRRRRLHLRLQHRPGRLDPDHNPG